MGLAIDQFQREHISVFSIIAHMFDLVGWLGGWLKIWCTHSRDSAPLINYFLLIRHHLLFSNNLITNET